MITNDKTIVDVNNVAPKIENIPFSVLESSPENTILVMISGTPLAKAIRVIAAMLSHILSILTIFYIEFERNISDILDMIHILTKINNTLKTTNKIKLSLSTQYFI